MITFLSGLHPDEQILERGKTHICINIFKYSVFLTIRKLSCHSVCVFLAVDAFRVLFLIGCNMCKENV